MRKELPMSGAQSRGWLRRSSCHFCHWVLVLGESSGPSCHFLLDILAFFCSLSIFPSCSLSSLPLFPYLLLGGPSSPTVGWWNTSLFTFSSAIWRNYLSSRPGLGGGIHTSNTCSMFLNSTYFRNARITSLCLIFFPFLPIPPLLTALSLISSLSQFIQLI